MMKKLDNHKGFTIIELLITVAIIGFILTTIYTFYLSGLQGWIRGTETMEAQQSSRIAINKIISELRYAHEVATYNNNSEVRFKIPGDTRTRRFRLLGEELVYESYPTGGTNYFHTKIALGISDLNFTLEENYLLNISLTAGKDSCQVRMTGSVYPRNLP